ncbi:hypothetical protein T265_05232 [Opisthorchis viverrini]|uniref:Uncharacterized protein n=1 Tax=Opisthorchis viverrini TaxID=6198 RepID=A0A075AFJ4_OPIVI|nr:hypothetical protein T265_05232 [Opisthorchis viverrini]KER27814.1 hypothetical protein T265_05232 [Opisthorchis viverrini]
MSQLLGKRWNEKRQTPVSTALPSWREYNAKKGGWLRARTNTKGFDEENHQPDTTDCDQFGPFGNKPKASFLCCRPWRQLRGYGAKSLTRKLAVRNELRKLNRSCLGLHSLVVSQSSCFLQVAWKLSIERLLEQNDLSFLGAA